MLFYIKTAILIIASPLFLIAAAAHLFIKFKMRPRSDSDLDEYYYEVEDTHPDLARYEKYSRITYVTAISAIILLFLAIAL